MNLIFLPCKIGLRQLVSLSEALDRDPSFHKEELRRLESVS